MTEEKYPLVIDDGRIESMQEYLSPEELYQDLIKRVRKYHPSDDITLIEKAYHTADEAHKEQRRKSGEPKLIYLSPALKPKFFERGKRCTLR